MDPAKLTHYCLHPFHPHGGHTARVLASALGIAQRDVEAPEEEELKFSRSGARGSGKTILALALLVLVAGAGDYIFTRKSSVQNAYSSIKESTQDAAPISRVRTALLLSKHVSPFEIKADTIQGEVSLEGQVSSEKFKTVAGAIAQDTSSVKQVHNNLSVNPSTERHPDREHLGERVADLEIQTLVTDALSLFGGRPCGTG